jgi:hypothetical protein
MNPERSGRCGIGEKFLTLQGLKPLYLGRLDFRVSDDVFSGEMRT